MTPEEAIKILENKKEYSERITDNFLSHSRGEIKDANETIEMCDMAISALKEIQQYREIGTVEECQKAVEKQKAKILEFYGSREDGKLLCQNCGEDLWDLRECGFNNCPYCGQAILWENLEGMEDD